MGNGQRQLPSTRKLDAPPAQCDRSNADSSRPRREVRKKMPGRSRGESRDWNSRPRSWHHPIGIARDYGAVIVGSGTDRPTTKLVGVQIRQVATGQTRSCADGRRHLGYVGLSVDPRLYSTTEDLPGREVPNPLTVEVRQGTAGVAQVMNDVMSLTMLNFNGAQYCDGLPVTLRFADLVGEILTAGPITPTLRCPSNSISAATASWLPYRRRHRSMRVCRSTGFLRPPQCLQSLSTWDWLGHSRAG